MNSTSAPRLQVGLGPGDRLVDSMFGARVGAGDDHEVGILARLDGGLDLVGHVLGPDHLATKHVATALGPGLVLDVDGRGPGALVGADRHSHVERVAVPGVAVGDDRHAGQRLGDGEDARGRLGFGEIADVRLGQQAGGPLEPADVQGAEAHRGDQARPGSVVGAWRDEDLRAVQQLPQPGGVPGHDAPPFWPSL
jgi:hypothetical protein